MVGQFMNQKSLYITDVLQRRAQLTPGKLAICDQMTGREITYAQWNAQANQTANYLRALGVQTGDRVAVIATNSMAYLDVWMACGKIGAVLQNLNWRLTVAELERVIRNTAPVVLVYSDQFIEAVRQLRPAIASVRHFVAVDALAGPGDHRFAERDALPTELTSPRPDLDWDSPWVICYTGGTTGLPKGAILSHGNMTWNATNTVMSWGLTPDDVAILNSPLFHIGGLNVFTLPLIHIGGTSLLCAGFDVDQVFDLVASGEVTLFFGVPTMFIMMQNHPRWPSADFSHCKLVISGGAPCPLPVFERFWEKGVDFKTGYGLTEAGPNTFWLPEADIRRKPGAVGFPLLHVDVRVVRADGSICTAGEPGELLIRGPHVTPGYWNNPAATAQTIVDGWLHTGDLAVRDEEGYYTIAGRLKDMIISGGENVYPAEVESVMYRHPAIREAALIGVPDDMWGEVGRAVVVKEPGTALGEEELIDFLRGVLARYKVPKTVVFVDALPKTGAGKIDKKELVRLYGA
jgi:fatty-acyl-CoA synthase